MIPGLLRIILLTTLTGLLLTGCSTKMGMFYRDIFDKSELEEEAKQAEDTYILKVPFIKQENETCCGAASLAMNIQYWTEDPESVAFLKGIECPEKGFKGKELMAMAVAKGFKAVIYKGGLPDLFKHLTATRPVMVMLKRYGALHYVVVVGYSQDGRIIINDPLKGQVVYDNEFFMDLWKGARYFSMLVVPKE